METLNSFRQIIAAMNQFILAGYQLTENQKALYEYTAMRGREVLLQYQRSTFNQNG
jgi:hypothetical protein